MTEATRVLARFLAASRYENIHTAAVALIAGAGP